MTTPTTDARGLVERLASALSEANDYVASELSEERAMFAGYEHASNIVEIEADQKHFATMIAEADAYLSTNPVGIGSKSVDEHSIEQRAREVIARWREESNEYKTSTEDVGRANELVVCAAQLEAALRSAEQPYTASNLPGASESGRKDESGSCRDQGRSIERTRPATDSERERVSGVLGCLAAGRGSDPDRSRASDSLDDSNLEQPSAPPRGIEPAYAHKIRAAHEALKPLLSIGPAGVAFMGMPSQVELWKLHAAFAGLTEAVRWIDSAEHSATTEDSSGVRQPSAPEPVAWRSLIPNQRDDLRFSDEKNSTYFRQCKMEGHWPEHVELLYAASPAPREAAPASVTNGLPEWEAASAKPAGDRTAIEFFVSEYEPADDDIAWRDALERALLEAAAPAQSIAREAAQEPVGEMDRTAPPRIWLQVDAYGDPEDRSEPIPESVWEDLSWHYAPIGGQEVEYIRRDLAHPAPQQHKSAPIDLQQFRGAVAAHHLACRRKLRNLAEGKHPESYRKIFEAELAEANRLLDLIDAPAASKAPLRPVTNDDVRAALAARDSFSGMRAALESFRSRLAGEGA